VTTARHIEIGSRRVGPGEPVYIIAEMSANHNQDYDQAVEIVRAAKACGADAIKLQTYTPDTLTINADKEQFMIGGGTLWDGRTLYDLYGEAYMPWDWQPKLKRVAEAEGLDLLSTAYDETALTFLEELGVPAHKVASFEMVDLPLIEKMALTGKPLIVSTGMASLEEIREAVHAARSAGAEQIALLKCTSAYPSPPEEMNLRTIPELERAFDTVVGLSDHTIGIAVPVASIALGACIIEKHFTLSRSVPGPDSAFSLEPSEFKAMVDAIRTVEKALGEVSYGGGQLQSNSKAFRRSLFVVEDVKAGEMLTAENVRSIRPGHGLPPKHLSKVLGRRATQDVERGTPLDWSLISETEIEASVK
jgi:pseudaminic acid synthase